MFMAFYRPRDGEGRAMPGRVRYSESRFQDHRYDNDGNRVPNQVRGIAGHKIFMPVVLKAPTLAAATRDLDRLKVPDRPNWQIMAMK